MRQGNFVRVEWSMRCKMSIFGWIAKKALNSALIALFVSFSTPKSSFIALYGTCFLLVRAFSSPVSASLSLTYSLPLDHSLFICLYLSLSRPHTCLVTLLFPHLIFSYSRLSLFLRYFAFSFSRLLPLAMRAIRPI